MNIIEYPKRDEWAAITVRPHIDVTVLNDTVRTVLDDIRDNGDKAVKAYEEKFDKATLTSLTATAEEIDAAYRATSPELIQAITLAHDNIEKFHEAQTFRTIQVETQPGVTCWQRSVAIESVGLYVPGGTAPLLSTVLMLAIPARIAGCKNIVLCTPPDKNGNVNSAILATARIAGIDTVYKIGGVQAIGAMAYGTETVPRVSKIFGPGNQYVMAAKQMVSQQGTAIDMPAGPSEVCVIADETSQPEFVAADLLSQAEHGMDSQVLLITTSREMLQEVTAEVEKQLEALPRKQFAATSLDNSKFVLVSDKKEAMALANAYAPEHLIIATADWEELSEQVVNAGSVFLGNYACESAGDYASGTNHTLPTHGYATAYNGVNLDSFCRKITFQHLTEEGVRRIGPAVERMAESEQLFGHKNAMTLRLKKILEDPNNKY